jgi:hypothetical protein
MCSAIEIGALLNKFSNDLMRPEEEKVVAKRRQEDHIPILLNI